MDLIKVNRDELLIKLQENLETHKKDVKEARKVWEKKAKKAYAKAAAKAEKGDFDYAPLAKLPKPESYVKSYEDAIARVGMDTRDELEIDDREFSAWVQDNWTWKGQFVANSSLYSTKFQ